MTPVGKFCSRILPFVATALLAGLLAGCGHSSTLQQIKQRGYARVAVANEIPYGYMDAQGNAHGFGPDVAREVLHRMGIDHIQWTVTGFGSLIPALKAGRVDLVAASQAILPQRCQQVAFSTPNTSYGEGLMVKKGNPQGIHSYQDFVKNPDLKMGIVSGADQLEFAHAAGIPDKQLVMLQTNTDAVSAVATGRIDAYAATFLTVGRLAAKSPRVEAAQPFQDPVVNGKPVRSWGAFTFRKGDTAFRKAFDKQLAAVQKTPFWRRTLKHYGLDDHSIDLVHSRTTAQLCAGK